MAVGQIGSYSRAPYSVRYSEAGFETPAVVGNLSQSNATGGAVGHTKSRWLFSLLGGAERPAGIIVLSPRSTFRQTRSAPTMSRRAGPAQLVDTGLWNSASLPRDGALTLSSVLGPLAIVCEPCGGRGHDSVTRQVEKRADAKLTDLSTLAREVASPYGPRTANGLSSVRKHD